MHTQQNLTWLQGTGLLISTLLGSSLFIIPAMAASIMGDGSVAAWALIIVCILPVAFCFSSLGAAYPNEGGTAFFIRQAFGEKWEHFTGWLFLSALPIGPPIILITGISYLGALAGWNTRIEFLAGIFALGLLFLLNIGGLKFLSMLQTWGTVGILLILSLLLGKAGLEMQGDALFTIPLVLPAKAHLLDGMGLLFWSFVGIEAVAHLAQSFKNVKRDFPLTIFSGIFVVGILCLLLGIVVLRYHAYGSDAVNDRYMFFLFTHFFGSYGQIFVACMAFFTCLASVNLYFISFSNMLHSMSEQGYLPSVLQKKDTRQTPIYALAVCYGVAALTLLLRYAMHLPLQELVLYANAAFVAVYLLASMAGLVLLRGWKLFAAVLSTIFCSLIFFSLGIKCLYVGAVFLLVFTAEYILERRAMVLHGEQG